MSTPNPNPNPYSFALIPLATGAFESQALVVPTVFDSGGEHMRITLSLTWLTERPSNDPQNHVIVMRRTSGGELNEIHRLTPNAPRLRDMPPDVYVLKKGVSLVPIGCDVSGFSAATTVSE